MEAFFAGAIAAAITGIVSYFIAKRSTSGSISTSDAASLWAESNKLRQEYRERAEQLEEQLKSVNTKLATVMEELSKLRANSSVMINKINELKKIIVELKAENQRLIELKGSEA